MQEYRIMRKYTPFIVACLIFGFQYIQPMKRKQTRERSNEKFKSARRLFNEDTAKALIPHDETLCAVAEKGIISATVTYSIKQGNIAQLQAILDSHALSVDTVHAGNNSFLSIATIEYCSALRSYHRRKKDVAVDKEDLMKQRKNLNDRSKCIELLLQRKANLDIKINDYLYPHSQQDVLLMQYATSIPGNKKLIILLTRHRAHLNKTDLHEATPLHHVCNRHLDENYEYASILCQYGALVNAKDQAVQTPLMKAVCLNQSGVNQKKIDKENLKKLICLLLEYGALVHAQDSQSLTALDYFYHRFISDETDSETENEGALIDTTLMDSDDREIESLLIQGRQSTKYHDYIERKKEGHVTTLYDKHRKSITHLVRNREYGIEKPLNNF